VAWVRETKAKNVSQNNEGNEKETSMHK